MMRPCPLAFKENPRPRSITAAQLRMRLDRGRDHGFCVSAALPRVFRCLQRGNRAFLLRDPEPLPGDFVLQCRDLGLLRLEL